MKTDEIEKPLPCPFCGEAQRVGYDAIQEAIMCFDCLCAGPERAQSEQAVTAWNTRTPDLAAEVVRLRKALEEILDLPDVDADNRSVIARAALEGRE